MPVYALIFRLQVKKYGGILERFSKQAGIEDYKSVLDVGCGNGALMKALRLRGLKVAGVDFLPAMAAIAKRNLKKDEDIVVQRADVLQGLPFGDKGFDMAIADLFHKKPSKKLPHFICAFRTQKVTPFLLFF
jgi:SAM-dependent methyltransferase